MSTGQTHKARTAARLVLLCAATAVVFVPLVLSLPAGARATRLRSRITRAWARVTAVIIGLTIRVEGTPPATPCYLVSNHLSYVDIIVLGSLLPVVFVAKSEIAGWPVMGTLSRLVNTVFVDRRDQRALPATLDRIDALMQRGVGIVVFPEGTSSEGRQVLPFRPALLEPAVRRGYGVSSAALTYTLPPGGPPARLAVCWWGDMTFGRHFLDLLGIRRLQATIRFGREPVRASDRRRLARLLHEEVAAQFTPVDAGRSAPADPSEKAWTASAS